MAPRVLILTLVLLMIAAAGAGCAGEAGAPQAAATSLPPAVTQPPPDPASTATTADTTSSPPIIPAGIELPTVAPLNPAFLDSLLLPPEELWPTTVIGQPLGLRPLPQDFSYITGAQIPSLADLLPPPAAPSESAPEALPRSYDLRTQGRVTAVKDQNPYGTCWSFATLGSLESRLLPGRTWDFSEDNMVLTSGFDHEGSAYQWGGTLEMSTAYFTRWGGPVLESADPYADDHTPAGLSPRLHVQDVKWIPPRGGPLDNDNVKRAIMQYGGVYVAMSWQDSASGSLYFDAARASYYYFGFSWANHAVLVVGWDDDYPASGFAMPPFGDGAFIVKNSWGPEFGDDGYFYVSYYDNIFGRTDPMGFVDGAEPTYNYSRIYQYDPLGDVNGMGYESPEGWFANVFTAQEDSRLSAVGFYALAPGTQYVVYAGSSLADLQPSTQGTLAYMGYHTVQLPRQVGLKGGTPFVVAVKLFSPGTDEPIAIEYPIARFSSAATAEPGQSYVSPDGIEWSDLTVVWDPEANVCLKAYARK
jgi:C1A family cysteine protease